MKPRTKHLAPSSVVDMFKEYAFYWNVGRLRALILFTTKIPNGLRGVTRDRISKVPFSVPTSGIAVQTRSFVRKPARARAKMARLLRGDRISGISWRDTVSKGPFSLLLALLILFFEADMDTGDTELANPTISRGFGTLVASVADLTRTPVNLRRNGLRYATSARTPRSPLRGHVRPRTNDTRSRPLFRLYGDSSRDQTPRIPIPLTGSQLSKFPFPTGKV